MPTPNTLVTVTAETTGGYAGSSTDTLAPVTAGADGSTHGARDAELLRHARAYLERGWKLFVIPASDDGTAKIPAANCDTCKAEPGAHDREACDCLLCHGFYAATDDIDRIAAMLDRCPGGSLALRTGRASGVSVIDAEAHADAPGAPSGVDVIDGWEDYAPDAELNTTAVARSASGGVHLFYATGSTSVRSMARVLPGVDVKADGGYVVLPPGAFGERSWLPARIDADASGHAPDPEGYGAPPMAAPSASLLEWFVSTRPARASRARALRSASGQEWSGVADAPEGYDFTRYLAESPPPGTQDIFLNDWFFRAVAHDGITSEDELFAMAWEHMTRWVQDPRRPWTEYDVRAKARNVLSTVEPAAPVPDWEPRRAWPNQGYQAVLREDGTVVELVTDPSGIRRELSPGETGDHGFRALTRMNGIGPVWEDAPATREDAARAIREMEAATRPVRQRREEPPVPAPSAPSVAPQETEQADTDPVVPDLPADAAEDSQDVPQDDPELFPNPATDNVPVAPVIPLRPTVVPDPAPDTAEAVGDAEADAGAPVWDDTGDLDHIIPDAVVDIGGSGGSGGFRGVGYHGSDGTCDGQPGTEGMSDTGNANRFVRLFGSRMRWLASEGVWLVWDGKRWQRDRTNIVKGWTVYVATDIDRHRAELRADGADDKEIGAWTKWMVSSGSNMHREAMMRCARAVPGLTVTPEMLDTNTMQLVVSNGVVDLNTGRLEKGRQGDLNTLSGTVTYDASATCPMWEKHVERVTCGDRELAEHLQRVAGYTLTGKTSAQAFFSLEGIGANGKNVFIETLAEIMGEYATTASTKLVTQGDRAHMAIVADLMGKRMVFVDEIPQGRHLDVERVKTLVGSAKIKAQFMARNWFEFQPRLKLWIAGNGEPSVRDASDGIWRRMRRILFKAVIPESERIPDFQQVLVEREGAGILNWALAGLADYLARGERLDAPASVTASVEELREDEDHVGQFMGECCDFTGAVRGRSSWEGVYAEGDWILTAQLMSVYAAWCDGMGTRPHDRLSAPQLVRRMVAMGAVRFNDRRSGERRLRGLEGVRLTTTAMGLWSSALGSR